MTQQSNINNTNAPHAFFSDIAKEISGYIRYLILKNKQVGDEKYPITKNVKREYLICDKFFYVVNLLVTIDLKKECGIIIKISNPHYKKEITIDGSKSKEENLSLFAKWISDLMA